MKATSGTLLAQRQGEDESTGGASAGRIHKLRLLMVSVGGVASVTFFTAFPTMVSHWVQILWLVLLVPLALVAGRWADADSGFRGVRPLTIFAAVFVLVLASRALVLSAGEDGRYFSVDPGTGTTESIFTTKLSNDEPEESVEELPAIESLSSETRPVEASIVSGPGEARVGTSYFTMSASAPSGANYVAVQLPGPTTSSVALSGGDDVVAGLAARFPEPLPGETTFELYIRYFDAESATIGDEAASSPIDGSTGDWTFLSGSLEAPSQARSAAVLAVLHPLRAGYDYSVQLDSPLVVAGDTSVDPYIPGTAAAAENDDAFQRALSICVVMLAAVILGYVTPAGRRLAGALPRLSLPGLEDGRTRKAASLMLVAGVIGYVLEMRSYGGYGGYLDALSEIGSAGLGKWYLHALAGLPSGMAVFLIARRIALRNWRSWGGLEILILVIGTLIPVSYVLKAAFALPLLTVLLFVGFSRTRGWLGIWSAAAVLAVLTPLVYLVRFSGRLDVAPLFTSEYWSEFASNTTSRFFHFESLMISVPSPSSDSFFQPVVDFVTGIVPRAIWDDKPLSTSARFTEEHLLSSLYSGSDVGIISLPGEAWLVGGTLGVILIGLVIGIGLRLAHALAMPSSSPHTAKPAPGTLLAAAGLTAGLVFLNDGWGLASAATVVLLAATGWILLLRREPLVR